MILRRVTSLKDENGDFITDSRRVLARWRDHFFVFEVIEKLKKTQITRYCSNPSRID
jgi:hypothetical protein